MLGQCVVVVQVMIVVAVDFIIFWNTESDNDHVVAMHKTHERNKHTHFGNYVINSSVCEA